MNGPQPPKSGGATRVLVVDDEPLLLRVMTRALSMRGYLVSAAASSEEAMSVFDPDIDVLVTDLALPRFTGVELAHCLRALAPGLPVLLISALRPAELGSVSSFLEKPFTLEALATAIDAIVH